jgi:endonuclease/exonuclease/phosphatase (EEP) superfamily protein YafD
LFELGQDYGVLSWNVFKSKKKGWEQDFKRLHVLYDLLLLQEAKLNLNQTSHMPFDPDYNWIFGESFVLDSCGSSCGVLTGSRMHSNQAFNRHGPIREPLLKTPKSSAFAFYQVQGMNERFLVINAHLINFRTIDAFEKQLDQISEVIASHSGPVLFAGDLNTWNASRKDLLFSHMHAQGLQNVIFANDKRKFLLLDYIFVRDLKVKEAHLLHDIRSSDHLPLAMWFCLPQK